MGEVIRLRSSRLTKPGMTAREVEAAALRTAADLASAAATWSDWQEHGFNTRSQIAIAEALCILLIRHNRRHMNESEVCNPETLGELERKVMRLLDSVKEISDRVPGPVGPTSA